MLKNNSRLIILISIISIVFFILVGLDISPYLRGPGPYPPDWRWEYYFINTLPKIWMPILIIFLICLFGFYLEKKSIIQIENKLIKNLLILLILGFVFQLSVLFFSRSGVFILLHRIINPDLNGYFTTSISIKDFGEFLRTYNDSVLSFAMHAKGHTPFAVLFFYVINIFSSFLTPLHSFIERFSPSHSDVKLVWEALTSSQKLGAVFSSIFITFLSSSVIIPLYFLAKHIYGVRSATRSALIYIVTPSVVLFTPINDVFLPLFPVISLFLFYKSLDKNSLLYILFSGIVMSIGVLFSLSLLPLLFLFFVIYLHKIYKDKVINKEKIILGFNFILGLLILPIFLLFFNFNLLEVTKTLMSGLPENREYITWIFYNLYDFFIFSGIPVFVLFIVTLLKRKIDSLLLAFISMLFLLNFSGAVRGEVARIWIPFIPILILIVINFLTNSLKLSGKLFLIIFLLQAIQVLVFQEFWVTLW